MLLSPLISSFIQNIPHILLADHFIISSFTQNITHFHDSGLHPTFPSLKTSLIHHI
jgi:hypothetical protein